MPALHAPPDNAAAQKLWLLDASLYIFRAWHSTPDLWRDSDGWPLNAVHGFARFLLDFLQQHKPQHIAVAFDEALGSCFRHNLYPLYKANRPPAPEELKRQFACCKALCEALGLTTLGDYQFEADDLIGSAATAARKAGMACIIVSADKDFAQLLHADDEQFDPPRQLRFSGHQVKRRLGVRADQVADFLALCGDAVDNIPGIQGVGPKTAASLLHHFGDIETLLARADEVAFLRTRGAAQIAQRLQQNSEALRLWRRLTTIACDAPLPAQAPLFQRGATDTASLKVLTDAFDFSPLLRQRLHQV